MSKRRCFILGAGFSRCCGLPLASELTPIVWRAHARSGVMDKSARPAPARPGDFNYEGVQADLKAIRLLFPDCKCSPDHDETWPDFEQLITSLDESVRFQRSFERVTGMETQNWAANTKRRLVHQMLERLSELTDAANRSGLELVKQFLQRLDIEQDTIVSFNWDVVLEIVAEELSMPVRYREDLGTGLRLAKPHGSINLVDSLKQAYEDARRTAINVFGLDEELEYGNGERHVILRAKDPRRAWIRQTWAPKESRVVVEPNLRKTYDNLWLEGQWVRALDMVRGADELIVIGFSLPLADLRPRILLQLTRVQRPSPPVLRVVDPSASALRGHYQKLTGLDARPFDGTLEQWLISANGRS